MAGCCHRPVHTLISKYQEFCQIFFLKQLITCPTHVTCNGSSLIEHILTNSTEKIFQSSIVDCGMSDYQLILCTRKLKQAKFNKHNNVFLRSLKHYTVNMFLNKLMKVVNEIAPSKEIRIKNNTQEWFDREISELIHAHEKLFIKFKK